MSGAGASQRPHSFQDGILSVLRISAGNGLLFAVIGRRDGARQYSSLGGARGRRLASRRAARLWIVWRGAHGHMVSRNVLWHAAMRVYRQKDAVESCFAGSVWRRTDAARVPKTTLMTLR